MRTGSAGLALIKSFEGLRLTAYLDGAGIPTIGYGHTHEVSPGTSCTEAEADAWLDTDLLVAETGMMECVKVGLTQNQFDALVSFTFNLGVGALKESTLLRLLNAGSAQLAAEQFPQWNLVAGKPSPGLTRRRMAEQALFGTPDGFLLTFDHIPGVVS